MNTEEAFNDFLERFRFQEKERFHFMEVLLIERIHRAIKAARSRGIDDDYALGEFISGYLSSALIVKRDSDNKHCFYVPDGWSHTGTENNHKGGS